MKTLFSIMVLGAVFISGCDETPKYKPEFVNADSNKIIGDLTFGIGKREAEIEIEKFNRRNDKYNNNDRIYHNFKYDRISCDYDSDRLYKICIHGVKNSKTDDTTELLKVITSKYQDPDPGSNVYAIRSKDSKNPFNYNNVKTWHVGPKDIVIQEAVKDTDRTVNLIIYKPRIQKNVVSARGTAYQKNDSRNGNAPDQNLFDN